MKILQKIIAPQESVSDEYIAISRLYFADGDRVKAGDLVLELEAAKASVALHAEADGFIEYFCKQADQVNIGQKIAQIVDRLPAGKKIGGSIQPEQPAEIAGETIFSPAAERLLRKYQLSQNDFAGRDFVSKYDVEERAGLAPGAVQASPPVKAPPPDIPGTVKVVPVSSGKQREISYLEQVQSAGLTSMVAVSVCVDGLLTRLNRSMTLFQDSLLPLAVYEVSRLLADYPELNAFYAGGNIHFYETVHIGLAMDIDAGLKVLTLPDADKLDLKETESHISRLINKYMDNTLTVRDLTGSTFTITDLSAEGLQLFMPLINKNQSAILGISGVDHDSRRCTFTLTFDHRVTAGKNAARFLHALGERIESYRAAGNGPGEADPTLVCYKCLKTLQEDKALQGPGLLHMVTHDGSRVYICETCFNRF